MSVGVERQAIQMSLRPMFDEADSNSLWFYHQSSEAGEVWCSPEYLRLQQSKGELLWAPEHWELRSPRGYINNLRTQIDQLVAEYNDLSQRFDHDKTLRLTEVTRNPDTP